MTDQSDGSPAMPEKESDYVAQWLENIQAATDEEKDWRAAAETATKAYRGEVGSGSDEFNIFHSNIETITPALYNSTPVPDVRRRYADEDKVGKAVADMLERAISYSVDAYDFDATVAATVRDMAIVDRGIARARYVPHFAPDESLGYEQVICEYVPWRSFRRASARTWSDITWVAFEHFLSKRQLEGKVAPEILELLPFTHSASAKDAKDDNTTRSATGKRAHVWEIWDKDKREVIFISPELADYKLFSAPDPLELTDFFPIPRPLQAIVATDTLIPITPYSIYASLVSELNEIQKRIKRLIKQLRPRGGYAGTALDFKGIIEAGDGELVPITGAEMFATQGGGIEKAITWFPLEPIVAALKQLVEQREIIKQTIYEVTGIADILRGASNSNETATAQNIKAQWGSLRVQRMQAEVARFARDLFRIKGEIIAKKFAMPTLALMTGLDFPPQQAKQQVQQRMAAAQQPQPQMPGAPPPPPAPPPSPAELKMLEQPSIEEVEKLLREDANRGFRIDIESDSTIRGDLTRNQGQMATFLQGTAQFVNAIGPMVEKGVMPGEIAIEILSAFTRQFKLGKQAEDALDKWADKARAASQNPQPEKPDPNLVKAEVQQKLGAQKVAQAEREAQIDERAAMRDEQLAQGEFERDMTKLEAEMRADQMSVQNDAARAAFNPPSPFNPGIQQ